MRDLQKIARCWNNGIKIYPVIADRKTKEVYIEVNYKGKVTRGKTKYKQNQKLYDKIMDGYDYYAKLEGL